MTALNFPASPSSGDVHNAANGLQYAFDGVKWTSQGAYDSGAINAQKLDSIAASFNGSTTTFNLKVNNATVKPHNEQSVSIVLNGHLQEPATAYTISTTNGTITFATAPASGTTFFGVLLSRIPITGGVMDGAVTNVKVAANAAIAGSKINPDFGSQNITTTGSITGTTTTQSAGDNTTKLASTAFVSTAIANLIDSSPATLDTLNELAAAINDDSDFHTTITNALAAKAPLASPTFTGTVSGISYNDLDNKPTIPSNVSDLNNDSGFITATLTNEQVQDIVGGMVTGNTETGITVTYDDAGDGTGKLNFATSNTNTTTQTFDDNAKAIFGTGGDGLEIYHDGSNSIIDDTGTGELIIYGSNIILQKHVSSGQTAERMADFAEDGAVRLYYDGVNTGTPANTVAVAKLETTASGISVSGNIGVSGTVDGRDLQTDGTKLDGIAANANNYSLPTATGSALGGVKVGSNLNIDSNGVLSAASSYSLPTASQSTLGGVKVGTNLTIDNNGVLSATQLTLTSSNINAVYGDTTQLILGSGTNDAALKLYYGTGSGTSYGVITADNGVHLQFDGANKLETTTNGIKINGGIQDKDGELGTNGQVLSSTGTELNWVNPSAYTLPTASGSTLGGIKVGTNLNIDGNGVLSSTQLILTSSNINAVYGDSTQLILGAADGDGDDALKLYYGGQYGVLTADNGVRLQYDGVTKFQTTTTGVDISGDLNIQKTTGANLVKIIGGEGAKAELQLWADDGDDASDKWQLIVDPTNAEQFFQIAGLGDDGVWNSAFYAVPNGRSELLFDGVKKLETGTTYVRVTGDLSLNNDGHKILLGAGQDLQLWHDGSHSYLKNQTNYQYYLSTQHHFANKANNELQAKFGENASVDLYYDNSKKLETTSAGATVTGSLGIGISTPNVGLHQHIGTSGTNSHQFTNSTTGSSSTDGFLLGLSGDEHVLLWNYENTPFRLATNSTERVRVASDGNVGIGTTVTNERLNIHTASSLKAQMQFTNTTTGTAAADGLVVGITGGEEAIFWNQENTNMLFATHNTERMRLTSTGATVTGDLSISSATPILNFTETNANPDYRLLTDGGEFVIQNDNSGSFATKFKVITSGVTVTGTCTATSFSGDGSGLTNLPGSASDASAVNSFYPDNGNFILGTGSGSDTMKLYYDGTKGIITADNGVYLQHDGVKKFQTNSGGAEITGELGFGSGGTYQIKLSDNQKARFGSGNDLQIYHNGTDTYIDNTNGELFIKTTTKFNLRSDGNEAMIVATPNGAVELKYDNSTKFETNSGGCTVTGNSSNTSLKLNTSDGVLRGYVYADTNNYLYLLDSQLHSFLRGVKDGTVELYYDNSKKFETTSNGAKVTGKFESTAAYNVVGAEIKGGATGYSEPLIVKTANNTTRFTVDGDGKAKVPDDGKFVAGAGDDLEIYHNGSNSRIINNTGDFYIGGHFIGLMNSALNEWKIKAFDNGAVELYFDGSKKLETGTTYVRITGDLSVHTDGHRLLFGASQDLQLEHDGTNSHIYNTTGELRVRSNDLRLMNAAGNEHYLIGSANGAVALYYDNSNKLETISSGVQVNGDLLSTSNVKVYDDYSFLVGSGNDLQIYHSGGHSYIDNNTGSLRVRDAGGAEKFRVSGTGTFFNDAIFPLTNNAHNIGSADLRWVNLFLSNALDMGDGATLQFGNDDDLKIYHNGTLNVIDCANAQNLDIKYGTEFLGRFGPNGNVELYYDASKKLQTTSSGITVTGSVTTNDINMSNLNSSPNEVDNTQGSWTLQEGANDLFLINRVNGKKYKFNLIEI